MKPTKSRLLACMSATLALSMPAWAEETTTTNTTSSTTTMTLPQMQKAAALNHLHHVNQKEIKLGEMARDKTQSPSVKDYANRMITDHQAADKKVEDMAKADGIELQSFSMATHEKSMSDSLGKLEGAEFDRAYMESMKMGHKHVSQDLAFLSSNSKDAGVKSLIKGMMPTIKSHERSAQSVKMAPAGQAGTTGDMTDMSSDHGHVSKDKAASESHSKTDPATKTEDQM